VVPVLLPTEDGAEVSEKDDDTPDAD